jgi:hypothetical protein
MYLIGMNPAVGLFTKAQMKAGKIAAPGTRGATNDGANGPKEYVVVKLAAATYNNGMAVTIAGDGTAATATTNAALEQTGRVGALVLGSATTTNTASGTSYCWAQIYGKTLCLLSGSVTAIGQALGLGADGKFLPVLVGSASAGVLGVRVEATNTAANAGLIAAFLTYPVIHGGGPA